MISRASSTSRIAQVFGLADDPFPGDPARGSFVATDAHDAALATMGEWISGVIADPARQDRLGLLTGEEGSGKTMLLAEIERTLSPSGSKRANGTSPAVNRVVTIPEALAHRSDAQLLKGILAAFGADPSGRTGLELRGELVTLLQELHADDIRPGLLIDGAHFKGSQLELVRNLLRDAEGTGLWIALFGLPDLHDRMRRRRSLRGLMGATVALTELSGADIDRLVDGRIDAVRTDETPDVLIADDARPVVREWAEGSPARAIRLTAASLEMAAAQGGGPVTRSLAAGVARELTIADANAAWEEPAPERPVQAQMPLFDDVPTGSSSSTTQRGLWSEEDPA